jgi:anti-anti-sigma factor
MGVEVTAGPVLVADAGVAVYGGRTPDGRQRLTLVGKLDVRTVADVRIALHQGIDDGVGELVVDVSGLEVADATGLGVLVGAHRRAGRCARTLVLSGVPPRLARLLAATRLHRILRAE